MLQEHADLMIYLLMWLGFGLLHSGMASAVFKVRWHRLLGRWACLERLLFNLTAMGVFFPILAYGYHHLSHEPVLPPLPVWGLAILWGLQAAGVVLMIWSLATYDLARFVGWRQLRDGLRQVVTPIEPLRLSCLHHLVRHPIYTSLLLVIWARPWDWAMLITNLCATTYVIIGAWFEERRLVALYGEDYRRLQATVPMLLPWRLTCRRP